MFRLVYITCGGNEEAERISDALVKEKLAACVNFFPINSVFEWEGEIKQEKEFAMLCKTTQDKIPQLKKRVKEIHSYEIPAILIIEIKEGNEEFLRWVDKCLE